MSTDDLVGSGFVDEEFRAPDHDIGAQYLFYSVEKPRTACDTLGAGEQGLDIRPQIRPRVFRQLAPGKQAFKLFQFYPCRICFLFAHELDRKHKTVFPIALCKGGQFGF